MSLRIGSVVLKVDDTARAGRFWSQALGYEASPADPAFLRPPHAGGVELHLDEDDRTHLDLFLVETDDARAEVRRLLALGARHAEWTYPDGADFTVLLDTEGNAFCVIETDGNLPGT